MVVSSGSSSSELRESIHKLCSAEHHDDEQYIIITDDALFITYLMHYISSCYDDVLICIIYQSVLRYIVIRTYDDDEQYRRNEYKLDHFMVKL